MSLDPLDADIDPDAPFVSFSESFNGSGSLYDNQFDHFSFLGTSYRTDWLHAEGRSGLFGAWDIPPLDHLYPAYFFSYNPSYYLLRSVPQLDGSGDIVLGGGYASIEHLTGDYFSEVIVYNDVIERAMIELQEVDTGNMDILDTQIWDGRLDSGQHHHMDATVHVNAVSDQAEMFFGQLGLSTGNVQINPDPFLYWFDSFGFVHILGRSGGGLRIRFVLVTEYQDVEDSSFNAIYSDFWEWVATGSVELTLVASGGIFPFAGNRRNWSLSMRSPGSISLERSATSAFGPSVGVLANSNSLAVVHDFFKIHPQYPIIGHDSIDVVMNPFARLHYFEGNVRTTLLDFGGGPKVGSI